MSNNQCNVCGGPVDSGGMCQDQCSWQKDFGSFVERQMELKPKLALALMREYADQAAMLSRENESLRREVAELRAELNTARAKQ